jgi:hypothetical protein
MEHARGASTLTDAFDHYCSVFRVQYSFQSEKKRREEDAASREGRHLEGNCEPAMHHWRDNQ